MTAVFFLIIISGLVGTSDPTLNVTAITWYLWFCLVFVMMVVGRAGLVRDVPVRWRSASGCSVTPSGSGSSKLLGLGRKMPEPVARYGFLLSVGHVPRC